MAQHPTRQELTPASISAILGGTLVVAAVIALVSTSWGTLSSLTKILTIASPVVALYVAGFFTRNIAHFREVSTISLVTASLAFPFALGITLFELASAPAIDGSFIALVGGISFLWFAGLEFFLKVRQISLLTYTSLASWIVATGSTLPNAPYFVDVSFIIIGILTLVGVHHIVPTKEDTTQLRSYLVLGALSFFTTVFTLGDNIWEALYVRQNYQVSPVLIDGITIASYLALGILGIVIATFAAKQWKATGERLYGELRLVAEQSILLLAAIPALFIALKQNVDDSILQTILAMVIAALSLAFASKVKLKQSALASWTLLGILVIRLLFIAFTAAELSWPVLVLTIGTLLFILAFFLSSRQKNTEHAVASPGPIQSLWGLGEPLPILSSSETPVVSEVVRADGTTVKFVHAQKNRAEHYLTAFILQGILFLIIIRAILPSLLGIY